MRVLLPDEVVAGPYMSSISLGGRGDESCIYESVPYIVLSSQRHWRTLYTWAERLGPMSAVMLPSKDCGMRAAGRGMSASSTMDRGATRATAPTCAVGICVVRGTVVPLGWLGCAGPPSPRMLLRPRPDCRGAAGRPLPRCMALAGASCASIR